MTTLKNRLFDFYDRVYKETQDLTLGCHTIDCGELCEDSDHIPELVAHPTYKPLSVRNGREVIDGMYWFLPFEHEYIRAATGATCADWEVVSVVGLPTARTPDPTDQSRDDRCEQYRHFSGHCPIFSSRPIACRAYPLRGLWNTSKHCLEVYTEMLCPFSKQLSDSYYETYVHIFADLVRLDIPNIWWDSIRATSNASSRVLLASYDIDKLPSHMRVPQEVVARHPLQYPNWREALRAVRRRTGLYQIHCHSSASQELHAVNA